VQIVGCIGNDSYGSFFINECKKMLLNTEHIQIMNDVATSYTQVIQAQNTGQRTFFHHKGANANFDASYFPLTKFTQYKIFNLGYLLLLDKLDKLDENNNTQATILLNKIQQLGFITSVDIVSESSDRFNQIIPPALKYIDYLIINELEAGRIVNLNPRDLKNSLDINALITIATKILQLGAKNIIIHAPEGALWLNKDINIFMPNEPIAADKIISSVGAGDAFCAGILYGVNYNLAPDFTLRLAHKIAQSCLFGYSATDNIPSIDKIIDEISG